MPSQRDVLRDLVACLGMNEDKVVQEYAAMEERGEVKRKNNKNGTSTEAYARALWRDAVRKGWVR